MKKALICGLSGQDDAYLARLLLDHGYEVVGASRDHANRRGRADAVFLQDRRVPTDDVSNGVVG